MICPTCKREYSSGKFCPECGTKLTDRLTGAEAAAKNTPSDSEDLVAIIEREKARASSLFEKARKIEFGEEESGMSPDERMSFAAELYEQAALSGHADAMCQYGFMLMYGYGVKRHTRDAIRWMEKGLEMSQNPDSEYCRTASTVLAQVKDQDGLTRRLQRHFTEEAHYSLLVDTLEDYQKAADKGHYCPLALIDGHLLGTAVPQPGHKDYQLFLDYARTEPAGSRRWSFSLKLNDQFIVGRLQAAARVIFQEAYILGID